MTTLTQMSKRKKVNYPWERYWAPRDGHFRLLDGFVDGSEFARDHGLSQAAQFEAFRHVPCLVLLGEPGIGKSNAMEQEFAHAMELIESGVRDVKKIDLREVGDEASFYREAFESEEMRAWKSGSGSMTLFIDSLDEGLMNMDRVTPLVVKGLNSMPTERLYLRIACRTAEWPRGIEDALDAIWRKELIQIRELLPLTKEQVVDAAKARAVDPALFLSMLHERDLKPLAIKPITLNFLLEAFAEKSELARTRKEVYEQGCLRLCEDERSSDGPSRLVLTAPQRLEVVSRIAATLVLCKKAAVWTGQEQNFESAGGDDVREADLVGGTENDGTGPFQVTLAHVQEARRTGLFTSRGLERLGWAHQTYAEFLAARYVVRHGLSAVQLRSLIRSADDPEQKLIPQLQETVAWMVGWDKVLFHDVLTTDPEVLLRSDVAIASPQQKEELVTGLVAAFGTGALSHRNSGLFERYDRLKYDGIADTLRDILSSKSQNEKAKDCALDIAFRCQVKEVAPQACSIALDTNVGVQVRATAAHFVAQCGADTEKAKLKPLAYGVEEDQDDQLKGYSLQALWPSHLTASEVFNLLTGPKKPSFYGGYKAFWSSVLLGHLSPQDMPVALEWLKRHQVKDGEEDQFDVLEDGVMFFGWKHLAGAPWIEEYATAALQRIRERDWIVGGIDAHAFSTELGTNEDNRHLLIRALVVQSGDDDLGQLAYMSGNTLLHEGDVLWMLGMVERSDGLEADKWSRLVRLTFRYDRTDEVAAILLLAGRNEHLFKQFEQLIGPTNLDDPATQELRTNELRWRERRKRPRPLLTPSPAERVESHLQRFEEGDMDAWWQLVHYQLKLEPDSTPHRLDVEPDLTKFPGWINADGRTRSRMLDAAKKFLDVFDPGTDNWLGIDYRYFPAEAGYKSLRLLQSVAPDMLASLHVDRWAGWVPIILHYLYSNEVSESDSSEALAALAYSKAPEAVRTILPELIRDEDRKDRFTTVLEGLKSIWDESLSDAVFPLIQEGGLRERTAQAILKQLFAKGYKPVSAFSEGLIGQPGAEHRTVAVGLLLSHMDEQRWSSTWASVCADLDLAKAVLIGIADHMSRHSEKLVAKLTEEQIAELFRFIEKHWPREQDPKTPHGTIYHVSPRMEMGYFRDSLLTHLRERGTKAACAVLEMIQKEYPHIEWLTWAIQEARVNARRKSWAPPTPHELRAICSDTLKRRIGGPNDLLAVVMESLERIQARMIGETPQTYLLWNEMDGRCRPKDENHFSDYLKSELAKDLYQRGVSVGREVEIRRPTPSSLGQQIDIGVSVSTIDNTGSPSGYATVIIEVKGNWNQELESAMESQLVNRYLLENQCQHGIYLVGWFASAKWDPSDTRKTRAEKRNLTNIRSQLEAQAAMLSDGTRVIRSFVMDLSW